MKQIKKVISAKQVYKICCKNVHAITFHVLGGFYTHPVNLCFAANT